MATSPVDSNVKAAITEAVEGEMLGKKWYLSKTFWANVAAAAAIVVQIKYGFVIPLEYQSLGMTFVNLMLRKITKEAVVW